MRYFLPVLLVLAGPITQGAETPPASDRPSANREITLDELNEALASFRKSVWLAPERMGHPAPDETGATLEGDLARYVLTDAALARLDAAQSSIKGSVTGGSSIIPATAMAPLNQVMDEESCRLMQVASYWNFRRGRAYHEDMIGSIAQRMPEADRPAIEAKLQALHDRRTNARATLERNIATMCADPKSGASVADEDRPTRIYQEYNALRLQAVAGLVNEESPAIKRTVACGPPTLPAGSAYGVVSRGDVSYFFPPIALNYEIAGTVRVKISWDATGCVTHTQLVESSGSEELDSAALKFGFSYVFRPAEADGKPVGGAALAPVKFQLK